MRINDGSICADCNLFEHECDVQIGDDYCCFEYCSSTIEDVLDNFSDGEEAIKECKSFIL